MLTLGGIELVDAISSAAWSPPNRMPIELVEDRNSMNW
jgi:hypothetical protein